jgi:hypothetical protein
MAVIFPEVHREHLSQVREAACTAGAFDRDGANSKGRPSQSLARFKMLYKSGRTHELAEALT